MADIIIGARRPGPSRTLRGTALGLIPIAGAVLVTYFIYERAVSYDEPDISVPGSAVTAAEGPGNTVALTLGTSSLSFTGDLAVLRTSGAPQAVGAAHGRLLGELIREPAAELTAPIVHAVPPGGFLSSLIFDRRLRWRYRFIDDGIPGHQLVEIAALLAGMKRSAGSVPGYEEFVRVQAALDVGAAAPWSSGAVFRALTRSLSVVTSLRSASGDRLLIGRAFALPGAGDGGDAAARSPVVAFIKAADVIPFVSVTWPGFVGVVSGLNAEGIAVMVHPVRTSDVVATRQAQPIALIARDVLENARTLSDAIHMLEHATPLGAASFLVVDGNARTAAVVERSPTAVAVERLETPAAVSDLFTTETFADDPDNDRAERVQPIVMRTRRAKRQARTGGETVEDLVEVLRDHKSTSGGPLPPGHRGAIYDMSAVHTAIFDASGMVLWVADGDAQAGFRAFDLRYELRGEGTRPAPPADIAPAADRDLAAATHVRRARWHLQKARRAWSEDARRRAYEHTQRALALSPSLPEALKLAGDLARERGDSEAWRRYYQRYLDNGADEMGAVDTIRALLEGP